MQILVILLFILVMTLDIMKRYFLPSISGLLPDVLSGIAFLLVLRQMAWHGSWSLRSGYVFLFAALSVTVIIAAVAAQAQLGPMVSGLRGYLRFIPFMLVPMVFRFTDRQMIVQLLVMAGLLGMQLPVTFLQRFVLFAGHSGDMARGTLGTGSYNGIVLCFGISVVAGLYYKRLISVRWAAFIGLCFFLPPTMAEVKGAFLLAPMALLIPAFYSPELKLNAWRAAGVLSVVGVGLGLFMMIYSYAESTHEKQRWGFEHRTDVLEFFTNPSAIIHYMAPQLGGYEQVERYGRVDRALAPLFELNDEPLRLFTGLGIGALTKSPADVFAPDRYSYLLEEKKVGVSFGVIIWEFGIIGASLIYAGLFMIWQDAKRLRFEKGIYGALGLAWLAAVPIFLAAMFWKNTLTNNAVMFIFVYFSGHVMAGRVRFDAAERRQRQLPVQPSEEVGLPPLLHVGRGGSAAHLPGAQS